MPDKYLICFLAIAVATLIVVVASEAQTIMRLRKKLERLQNNHTKDNV